MSIMPIGTDSADLSLEDLAIFIWGNEIDWGQASHIGNDKETTVVVFDDEHVPSRDGVVIHTAVVRAEDEAPANAKALLCSGKAFVSREVTAVKVFRI